MKVFCLALLSAFVCTNLQAATIEQIICESIATHPQICSKENAYQSTRQLVSEATGQFFPQGRVEYNTGPEWTDNSSTTAAGGPTLFRHEDVSMTVTQNIFDGGQRRSTYRQRKANYCGARAGIYESQELIGFRAAEAYLNELRVRKIVEISEENVRQHIEMVEKVHKKVQAGAGKSSEIQLANSRLAQARSQLFRAESRLRDTHNTFIEVAGMPPPEIMKIPAPITFTVKTVDEALEVALSHNPSIGVARAQVASTDAQQGISLSAMYPKVNVDLYGFHGNELNGIEGPNSTLNGFLNIEWDFFTSGSNLSRYRSDKALHCQAICDLRERQRVVEKETRTSFETLGLDNERLEELILHRVDSAEVFFSYIKEFEVGERSLFDLLNAEIEYYNAQIEEVNGHFDVYTDCYRLLASMGKLINYISCDQSICN